MRALKLKGKNLFHVKYIKLSYRIRGSVARTQINSEAISIVFITISVLFRKMNEPVMKIMVRSLIIKMLAYSAIKIRANFLLLYSILNPDTNSDSPSAKSKGVRFVSAKFVITHVIISGAAIAATHEYIFIDIMDMSM